MDRSRNENTCTNGHNPQCVFKAKALSSVGEGASLDREKESIFAFCTILVKPTENTICYSWVD